MSNPIKNLGDYNKVREDLQEAGGCIETLYKNIGDTAVLKATPRIQLKAGLMGSAITLVAIGVCYLGQKRYQFLKDRKEAIENEPDLKKEFIEAIEVESLTMDNEKNHRLQ